MSHKATNWAFAQTGLKPAGKLVLLCLADRHNNDMGCFPSQATLARDACISRSSVNDQLAELEALGLIRREPRIDPRTRKVRTTRYILGFEDDFPRDDRAPCPDSGHGDSGGVESATTTPDAGGGTAPCANSGHGAVSDLDTEPCPDPGQIRVQNLDTNREGEPGSKKEEARAGARVGSEDFFEALLSALGVEPAGELPAWWRDWPARAHVRRWRDELGLAEDRILEIARTSRRHHPRPPDGPKALDRVMERAARRSGREASDGSRKPARKRKDRPPPASFEDQLAFYADMVNSDRFIVPSAISNAMRDALLARGLVTEARLRERGVP